MLIRKINKPLCKVQIVFGSFVGSEMFLDAMNMWEYLMWFLKGTFCTRKLAQAVFPQLVFHKYIALREHKHRLALLWLPPFQFTADLDSCKIL